MPGPTRPTPPDAPSPPALPTATSQSVIGTHRAPLTGQDENGWETVLKYGNETGRDGIFSYLSNE